MQHKHKHNPLGVGFGAAKNRKKKSQEKIFSCDLFPRFFWGSLPGCPSFLRFSSFGLFYR
jgi:hypothetical protein